MRALAGRDRRRQKDVETDKKRKPIPKKLHMPEADATAVTMYGATWCGDCRRAQAVLNKLSVEFKYETEGDGRAMATKISGKRNIPCILFPDGSHLTEPSDSALEKKLKDLKLA